MQILSSPSLKMYLLMLHLHADPVEQISFIKSKGIESEKSESKLHLPKWSVSFFP